MRALSQSAPSATGEIVALPSRLVLAVASGVLLNPLNSSMIAVALLDLGRAFDVDIGTATWLVSAFYVGGAFGMPLMGRLADAFGPRRVFCLALLLVGLSSAAAPVAPGFGWLVVLRVVLAFGTSAGYPAGLAVFRRYTRGRRAPAAALGVISVASSVSSALGPVIGGGLVALSGWPAIFLVNIPLAVVVLVLGIAWLPADSPQHRNSLPTGRRPLPVTRRLAAIYAQFGAVNVVFYSVFFGVPLWLQAARGFGPGATGLLLLPIAGVGVLATPLATRMVNRSGPKPTLILGSVLLLVGSVALLLFDRTTPLPILLTVGAILGIPNAFNNLGLQAALYAAAGEREMGSAGGLFQTFRYVGAIAATAMIGLVFGVAGANEGLHVLAVVMSIVSALLIAASRLAR